MFFDYYYYGIFDVLDHGLYEYLPPNIRSSLCGLWVSVVEDNHKEMRRLVLVINDHYSRKISMLIVGFPFTFYYFLFLIEIDVHSSLVKLQIEIINILLNFSVQARSEENYLIITQNFVCC